MLKRIVLSLITTMTIVLGIGVAAAAPDLAITGNTVSLPGYGGSGNIVNISLGFTNSGSTVATGGSIVYTLPSELRFATVPSGWTVAGQTATLTGNFAPGFSAVTGFTATINNFYTYRTVTGTAVSSVAGDTNSANNTLSDGVLLGYAYGLQKVVSEINGNAIHSGRAIQGDVVEFTLTFTNSGTVPFAVNLTDTVSSVAGMIFAQSSYSQVYSTLLPGGSTGFSFTGTVTATSFAGITNTVNAFVFPSSTIYAQIPLLASPTASVTLLPQAVISIVKNPPLVSPQPGTQFAYTLLVTNAGSTSAIFDLTDVLPASDVSFVSITRNGTPLTASPSCVSLGLCTFTNQTVAANSTLTYILTGQIQGGAASTFVNTGQIATSDATVVVADAEDTASVTLAGVPDLFINKSLSTPAQNILQSGDLVVFSYTFGNSGTQTIPNAVITDTFTSQLTYVSGTLGGVTPTQVGSTLTFSGLNLTAGSSVGPQTLTFRVTNRAAEGQNFTNTGSIALPSGYPVGYEPALSNNRSSATGTVIGVRDLFVTKTLVGSAPTLSGNLATYQLTIGNGSGATRSIPSGTTLQLTDTFPNSYYRYVSSSVAPLSTGANNIAWAFSGPFVAGQTQTLTATFQLIGNFPMGTSVTNTGTVYIAGLGLVPATIVVDDEFAHTLLVGGSPDLRVVKLPLLGSIQPLIGTGIGYAIAYQNLGTATATNFSIVDTLPVGMSPVLPLSNGGVYNASTRTITWTIPSLGTGAVGTGVIYFTGTITSLMTGSSIDNVARIDPSNTIAEPDETNNISTGSTTIIPFADIAITSKTIVSQGAPLSGSTTVFAINYINNGTTTGGYFAIADTLPSIFNYVSGCNVVGAGAPAVLCSPTLGGNVFTGVVSPVGPGQTGQFLLPLVLNTQPVGTVNFTNTARLNFDDPSSHVDGNSNNDTGSVSGQFTANLNVQVNKVLTSLAASGGIDMSGALATFAVTLTNNGDIPVSGSLIDGWPIQYLSNNNSSLNISGISLPVGSSQIFMFSGNLLNRNLASFQNVANFNYSVAGTPYSATGVANVTVPQPLCGNQILEANEQCEIIGSSVYGATLATGQSCVACQVRTTSILNVAEMCIGPGFTQCDTSSVLIPVILGNPAISIDKSVTPSTNLTSGNLVTYTIVLANSGSTVNNVVFQDIWPWAQVAYVSHTTSPAFNLTVNPTSQIMSGTIGVFTGGTTYTITLTGRVQTNTQGTVNNIATATYTNNLNQVIVVQDNAVINIGQGGLCDDPVILGSRVLRNDEAELEVTCNAGSGAVSSTQIVINCGNGDVYTGAGTSLTRTCTYDDDDDYTVSCTIDGYTDNSCEDDIDIIDPEVNICGDGIISQLEQCDLGDDQEEDVYVTIEDILGYDLDGDEVDSDEHEGASCYNCAIIDEANPVTPPVCTYTDTSLSVMEGELLPFRWNVDLDKGSIESVEDCDADTLGDVIRNTMICEFAIIHNNDGDEVVDTVTFPCDQDLDYDIFDSFTSTTSENTDVDDAYGKFLIQMSDNLDSYGEYKIRLEKVQYNYCALQNGEYSSIHGIPYCRVCETNFAVTRPYLMQVGASSAAATDSLEDFYDIRGEQILNSSDLADVDSIRYSDYEGGNIDTLLSSFITKYNALGVNASMSAFGGATSVKKVPGRNIFIVEGDVTYQHNTSLGSATIIVRGGDLEIKGNVSDNLMFLVPDGSISFSDSDTECNRQVVRGIFVAGEGFAALDEDTRHINNDQDKERCREGGLTVQGVMVGDNIEELVLSKRSHLNHWFTFDEDAFGNDEDQRRERRDEIINGASVLIQYNASLWSSLPPGGSEIVETLDISKN